MPIRNMVSDENYPRFLTESKGNGPREIFESPLLCNFYVPDFEVIYAGVLDAPTFNHTIDHGALRIVVTRGLVS